MFFVKRLPRTSVRGFLSNAGQTQNAPGPPTLERATSHSAGVSFGQAASSLARDGISSRVPGARETRGSILRFHAKSAR